MLGRAWLEKTHHKRGLSVRVSGVEEATRKNISTHPLEIFFAGRSIYFVINKKQRARSPLPYPAPTASIAGLQLPSSIPVYFLNSYLVLGS